MQKEGMLDNLDVTEIELLESQKKEENRMGNMPIAKLMISLSWPAMLSMLIQALYNIVDSMFVGMISESALTSITLIFPVQMLLISVAIGTGVGVSSLIARRLGAKMKHEADSAASHGFFISFINWIAFAIFGILGAVPFMNIYDVSDYITSSGVSYLRIICISSLFIFVQLNAEKVLQATGNTFMPMIVSLTGAVINIILDPVLIFGIGPIPKMGVVGAAIATVFGQFVSMCLGLYILFKYDHEVSIDIKGFKFDLYILKNIYIVGLPSILMQAVSSFMIFFINNIIAVSQTAVAVFGSYYRLQTFVFMPVFGLNQGALPIIAYNFGAKDKIRLMKTFKFALMLAVSIMAVGLLIFIAIPGKLLMIFSASDNMLKIGIPALRILSLCFIPAAFGIMTSTTFQATGHGLLAMWQALIRQLIGIVPIAYILVTLFGITACWWAFPLGEIFGVTFAAIFFVRLYKKEIYSL